MFCELNGLILTVPADDAVAQMVAVAAGEVDEAPMARWLTPRLGEEGEAE